MNSNATQQATKRLETKKLRDGKWWWIGLFSIIFVFVGGGVGLSVGNVHISTGSTNGIRQSQFTQMIQNGQMQQMFDQHERMLERMRVDASPQMLNIMNADPMWKLMRTGMYTKMLEEYQHQLNQMLATQHANPNSPSTVGAP
jgi:ABC-type lipoprotein release transport system permease subunit